MQIFAYFNINKRVFSLRAVTRPQLVLASADRVVLRNAVCKVSEAGRQTVIRTKTKNVHAGILADLVCYQPSSGGIARPGPWTDLTDWHGLDGDETAADAQDHGTAFNYNPYTQMGFTTLSGDPVTTADLIVLWCSEERRARAAFLGQAPIALASAHQDNYDLFQTSTASRKPVNNELHIPAF
jgi:hypothetical protein